MPIYEFYCSRCNTVFSFFSRSVNTAKIPACPQCRRPLKRQMSLFAKGYGRKDDMGGDDMPPLDEAKMEKAMAMLAGEEPFLKTGKGKRGVRKPKPRVDETLYDL
jgi:putative FmdB family regulatory protein